MAIKVQMGKLGFAIIGLFLPIAVFALNDCSEPQYRPVSNMSTSLIKLVDEATSSADERKRTSAISEAAQFVSTLSEAEIDKLPDEVIDKIAALLSDQNDAVKYFAASTLAALGQRAKRALPELELAWKRAQPVAGSEAIGPSLSPAEAFKRAITRISERK